MEKNKALICDDMTQTIIETAEMLVTSLGAENITVRKILQTLNITNRVFYNRFHNIDEVLDIVYENTILKIRSSIITGFDPEGDFCEQVINIVANTLIMSYENKMNFNQYVFEADSVSGSNYEWWKNEIKKLIDFGKSKGVLKDVDSDVMSYSIWCFIRGYNADAVGRKLPKEEAVANFKYSFKILLDGMKN
ncbi:MAG: TetR/AcrR family transcriptional regulator [Ruminococcaceae bacterium]|nr:TetR/AcrR family transcriptional regulator [Oscillospiraceae bacterium]